jgi:hypothetical protein
MAAGLYLIENDNSLLMLPIRSVGSRSARGSPFGTLPGNSRPDRSEIFSTGAWVLCCLMGRLRTLSRNELRDCSLKFRARDAKKVACHASPGVVCNRPEREFSELTIV